MLQHVDHHGTHHRYALFPFYHLPQVSQIVYRRPSQGNPVFPAYLAAFLNMLPCLLDPKVGSHWKNCEQEPPAEHRQASTPLLE